MKKILAALLCFFYPVLALADTSTTSLFTPPTTDYSVVFLGNIFGVVDGVLHGTGSQIMGKMFLVVNAAVLALGGIMVTYILIVGTMNTSHEGQFLGQKWSGIWIPMRGVIGLAMIMPKASGYCLMQVFIMWVVVQGVGAADKVWNAALDYLNAGGVLVGAQNNANPTTSDDAALTQIATGESAILQGQVCMYGIQTALEKVRSMATDNADSGGLCHNPTNTNISTFCSNPIPDFLNTFSAVQANNLGKTELPMPNFSNGSMYEQLNGICGTIKWNKLDMASETSELDYISAEEVAVLNQSRAVAIDQMYMDLMPTATAMVNNDPDPALSTNTNNDPSKQYSAIAQDQYGVPYFSSTNSACTAPSTDCMSWQPASGGATSNMIFGGAEFMYAMSDYNAIMTPTLNLIEQNKNAEANNEAHEFITHAKEVGWIMASSYFFDLVRLNGSASGGHTLIDSSSGLETSVPFSSNTIMAPFNPPCSGVNALLCTLLSSSNKAATAISDLITGNSVETGLSPNVSSTSHAAVETTGSASTYGYINNASMIHFPGQPGLATPKFNLVINIKPTENNVKLPSLSFSCVKLAGVCWGRDVVGKIIYDAIVKNLVSFFLDFLTNLFSFILQLLLIGPLTAIMTILYDGVKNLNTSQYHPIVGLAFMGTSFINYVTQLYFQLVSLGPILQLGGGIMVALIMPFLGAWCGIMLMIGFLDAYYVPFLPYMIFTFGSLGWFIAVMEAMVAGPIVALGITNPEGHDALGKAEPAMVILINLFLRPTMMILGFIGGIVLSYVGIYVLNAGFQQIMQFFYAGNSGVDWTTAAGQYASGTGAPPSTTPYYNFAALYAGFFCMLTYTTIYVTLVEKAFSLIHIFPDNMSRWIGGQAEQHGRESAQWAEAVKQQLTEGSKETGKASIATSEGVTQRAGEKLGLLKKDESKGNVK